MPGKEILIARPEEITVVYYTEDFKLSGYLISEPKKVIYVPGKILNIVL